jgi:hypothetical protein
MEVPDVSRGKKNGKADTFMALLTNTWSSKRLERNEEGDLLLTLYIKRKQWQILEENEKTNRLIALTTHFQTAESWTWLACISPKAGRVKAHISANVF